MDEFAIGKEKNQVHKVEKEARNRLFSEVRFPHRGFTQIALIGVAKFMAI